MRTARPLTDSGKKVLGYGAIWAAGFVDAVGYLSLRRLYTANMSGNSVSLGIQAARWNFPEALRHGWPILMYVMGLGAGATVTEFQKRRGVRSLSALPLASEILMLSAFALLGGRVLTAGEFRQSSQIYYVLVSLAACAMGIQNVAITRLGALSVSTTYVTGTLTKFAEASVHYLFWLHDRVRGRGRRRLRLALAATPDQRYFRRAVVIGCLWLSYIAGAVCGTMGKLRWELASLWLPVLLLAAVVGLDLVRPIETARETGEG